MNIYLIITLVGEYCPWRKTIIIETRISEAYVKVVVIVVFFLKIFINIDKGRIRRGGLAQFWSYEKLPVKSSGRNCRNTSGQNCRFK